MIDETMRKYFVQDDAQIYIEAAGRAGKAMAQKRNEAVMKAIESVGTVPVPCLLVYQVGQRVALGPGEEQIEGRITGVSIRGDCHVTYEVSWWNGRSQELKWLEEFEVAPVGEVGHRAIGFHSQDS